jgi:hypothetical protein
MPFRIFRPPQEGLTMTDFAGRWLTTFGLMILRQDGRNVSGTYGRDGTGCVIRGTVEGGKFTFDYEEPAEKGSGWFLLTRYGRFSGEYLAQGAPGPRPWKGERDFDGLWDSSFGRMRLIQEEGRVHGCYGGPGPSTIEGRIEQGRLVFRYIEPSAKGNGWFELDADQAAFRGQWRPDGESAWREWQGRRVWPVQGLVWLVVLESHWQTSLEDSEFAFGNMLRELFARLPYVNVRQRFFQDEASLLHWCRELAYLAEPTVLVIASHGLENGLHVHGRIIDTRGIIDGLKLAESLRVLHFSSCLVGQDQRLALAEAPFPVSGYTTSVDWAESALLEFIYLDMILGRGIAPAAAAEQLTRLVGFAGSDPIPGSPYPPANFRFFDPSKKPATTQA